MHIVACIIAMMALLRASSASPVPSDSKAAILESVLSEATQQNTQEMTDEAQEQGWGKHCRKFIFNHIVPRVVPTGDYETVAQELDNEAQEQGGWRKACRKLIFKHIILLPNMLPPMPYESQAQEIDKEAQEQILSTVANYKLALPHVLNAVTGGGEEIKEVAQEQFWGALATLAAALITSIVPFVIDKLFGGEEMKTQEAHEQIWDVLPHLLPHVVDAVTGGETQAQDLNKMALEQMILPFLSRNGEVPAKEQSVSRFPPPFLPRMAGANTDQETKMDAKEQMIPYFFKRGGNYRG